jgi:hypothetical protein
MATIKIRVAEKQKTVFPEGDRFFYVDSQEHRPIKTSGDQPPDDS